MLSLEINGDTATAKVRDTHLGITFLDSLTLVKKVESGQFTARPSTSKFDQVLYIDTEREGCCRSGMVK